MGAYGGTPLNTFHGPIMFIFTVNVTVTATIFVFSNILKF